MRRVRKGLLLACVLAACCGLPPRVDDRSTPISAFETFRGAVARAEYDREWACLSDPLRERLGLQNSLDWKDARAFVLHQGHLAVKGIRCSDVDGAPAALEDGRVRIELSLPLGYEARVWMRPILVLRAQAEGEEAPAIYDFLDDLILETGPDSITIRVPGELMREIESELSHPGRRFTRIEVAELWFLDGFETGEEDPDTVRQELEERELES